MNLSVNNQPQKSEFTGIDKDENCQVCVVRTVDSDLCPSITAHTLVRYIDP
jgi:hypothetical protein